MTELFMWLADRLLGPAIDRLAQRIADLVEEIVEQIIAKVSGLLSGKAPAPA